MSSIFYCYFWRTQQLYYTKYIHNIYAEGAVREKRKCKSLLVFRSIDIFVGWLVHCIFFLWNVKPLRFEMTFDYRPKVDQHNGLLNHRGIPTFLNDVKFQMRIFFWKSRCHHHHYDGWPVYIIQSKTETIDYYKYSENYKIKTLKGFFWKTKERWICKILVIT